MKACILQGLNCCSTRAISFHHLRPAQMYVFEYFLYRLRPYREDDGTEECRRGDTESFAQTELEPA